MTGNLDDGEFARLKSRPRRLNAPKPGILVADETALSLVLLKVDLESCGFNVWLADNGNDAIDVYRNNRDNIDLVLLSVQLPRLDGPQTLAALRWLDPNIVACFITNNTGPYSVDDLLDRGIIRLFRRPFRPSEISSFLKHLLKPWDHIDFKFDPNGAAGRPHWAPKRVHSFHPVTDSAIVQPR
jgi:CheY-like chemotaxis protein